MVLRDIFDHSGNITQIAKPQRTTNQKSESQISTSSRSIVGAASYAGLAANAVLGGADGLPEYPHPVLLLRANDLVLSATHLRKIVGLLRNHPEVRDTDHSQYPSPMRSRLLLWAEALGVTATDRRDWLKTRRSTAASA